MFTLKIRWTRYENLELADEATYFIPADQVSIHGAVKSLDEMKSWEDGSFFDYHTEDNDGSWHSSRLIQVDRNDKSTWYLVSHAWLLGPDGKTIERLT